MELTRRRFLGTAGAATGAAVFGPRFGFERAGAAEREGDVIVLVFLRGGMDGLSLVSPSNMASYRSLRPNIRVKTPDEFADPDGKAGLALSPGGNVGAFDGYDEFFLHPQAAALHETAWTDGNLAIVHAAGMPAYESDTRSHFSSTRNWEIGSGSNIYSDGFLNRFLAEIEADSLMPGMARGSQLSLSLAGSVPAMSMTSLSGFGVSGFADNPNAQQGFDHMYNADSGDLWQVMGAETLAAIGSVQEIDWSSSTYDPANGATYSNSNFGRDLRETASLIKADLGMRAATVSAGGWDHHSDMGEPEDSTSLFSRVASDLANNLAAFYTDLGDGMDSVTLVTISEFGRTINENSNGGTDHGRANTMLVMGNNCTGGVHGDFVDELTDGPEGDLTVINDYRTVLSEVMVKRGGAVDTDEVFPTLVESDFLGVCT